MYRSSQSSYNTMSYLLSKSSSSSHKLKTQKCQPAARDTLDLIQTMCVPGRGLARHKNKNKQNVKQKKRKRNYFTNITLASKEKSTKSTKSKQNKQKCQPAARDTLDLIQTMCVPGRGLARHKNKNKLNVKQEKRKRNHFANVTLASREKQTKSKQNKQKCQPAARDTLDLIQTMCVPGRGLARHKNKNKLNAKYKKEKRNYFANVTLARREKRTNSQKNTQKCQPAARDTQDLIQTWCVPDRGLARHKNKNKPNVKNKRNKRNYFTNVTLVYKKKLKKRDKMTFSWSKSAKLRNKEYKMINGNIPKINKLKVISWNLGSRKWSNKVDEINHMILDHNPDIAAISEANLYSEEEDHNVQVEGYDIITTLDFKELGVSRLVVLARKELNYKVMNNLMETNISTIWLSFPRRGKKPFILGCCYREHHLLNQPPPNISAEPALQKARWSKAVKQWASIQPEADVLFTGDLNLDFSTWQDPDAGHRDMVEEVKNKIETKGFAQLVTGYTRFWQDVKPSLIDHSWTNNPGMVIHCKNSSRPVADHNLVETLVRLKGCPKTNLEIKKRNTKNLDIKKLQEKIKNYNWEEIYKETDVNLAYNFLEEKLREALDETAPIIKIQPGGNRKCWVTDKTKEHIESRNELKNIAVTSNKSEDWNHFRKERNKVTEMIRKDKKKHLKELFEKAGQEKNSKALFRITKRNLAGTLLVPPLH